MTGVGLYFYFESEKAKVQERKREPFHSCDIPLPLVSFLSANMLTFDFALIFRLALHLSRTGDDDKIRRQTQHRRTFQLDHTGWQTVLER